MLYEGIKRPTTSGICVSLHQLITLSCKHCRRPCASKYRESSTEELLVPIDTPFTIYALTHKFTKTESVNANAIYLVFILIKQTKAKLFTHLSVARFQNSFIRCMLLTFKDSLSKGAELTGTFL